MFKTVKRIIDWCGEFKGKLYLGFVMTFFSHIFAALPLALAAYTVGLLIESQSGGAAFDAAWIWKTIVIQIVLVLLRFLFDYLRARLQEPISYQLTARDRLAVGDALKRVSLGYFQTMSTGNILNSITTGLSTLENMGIRMIDNFIGGYLNFLVIFVCLAVCSPVTALIALAAAALSLGFMLIISHYSSVNAPVEAQANRDMTGAVIEYARGLAVVKSFGKSGAAMESVTKAIGDSKRIHLKIEWGYVPANALHLLALKCGSVGLAFAAAMQCLNGQMDFSVMLMFVFFSFSIFASLEPISDSAHTLGVIDDAMDQLDALRGEHFIDADGHDVKLGRYDIRFNHVDFGYDERKILKDVSFTIPEKTSTAIVGPSGSGKSTLLNMLGGLDTPSAGRLTVHGHNMLRMKKKEMADYKRNEVGFVWQNNARNMLPFLSAYDNVVQPMVYAGRRNGRERRNRAEMLLELVGLKDRMKNKVDQLSGGEQQRVAIAIAMANEPALLLADEPTGAVDTKTADQILDIFRTLNQTLKQTIVVVTHDYRMSEKVDRVVNIRDGKTSSEIIRNISYADELKHLHQHNAEAVRTEWIMLDRAGRLQLPQSYLDDLAIKTPGRIIAERDGERLVLRKE